MVPKEWRISIPYRKLLPIDASPPKGGRGNLVFPKRIGKLII